MLLRAALPIGGEMADNVNKPRAEPASPVAPVASPGETPPAEHYQPSPRLYSGRLREPDYVDDWQVRRVRHSGEIKWRGRGIYISESLVGEAVGLAEREDGDWDIHFGPVRLGRISTAGRFIRPKRRTRRPKPVRG